ncbi:MAG TPA: Ig-like domain-containing protein [Anaerolineales bacterium]|nr:Ig-like domain-containing protein [Anaerolineales bacterium]HNN13767.1 Ig-like domain-containing protein [Anaerolineales bacterium]
MKKISIASSLAIFSALFLITSVLALVTNGGFETGDFTGWTLTTGINNGFSTPLAVGGSDLSAVVGGAAVTPLSIADPNSGGSIMYPAYGHYSARINSEDSWDVGGFANNANTISQNITAVLSPVDNQAHIQFVYSAVMVNPVDTPHTSEEKPYFRVRAINTSNGNDVLYDFSSYVGEPGKNWQNGPVFAGNDFWQHLDWTFVDLASSAAHPVNAGDIITLEITAAGCSLGGHPGYVYVDEVTDGNIGGPTIKAAGPATKNAGTNITYTYTYTNNSGNTINPTIVINPPANVTFNTLGDPGHCSGLAPVTCNFTGVTGGSTGSFTVTGKIALTAAGTTIAHGDYSIAATGFPTLGGPTVFTNVPANDPPVAQDDSYSTHMSVLLNGSSVFANDTDPENDALRGNLLVGPSHASAFSFNRVNGSFSYTPENGFQGVDTFTYRVKDLLNKSNDATVTINVTPLKKTFISVAPYDGWVKESGENSNTGLSINSYQLGLPVGDDSQNQQYRSILHFETGFLPDNTVILSATVRVKRAGIVGNDDPFVTHGQMVADMKKGYFGTSPAMQSVDFQGPSSANKVGTFITNPVQKWYRIILDPSFFQYVGLSTSTQFRLRFLIDDDNNLIDNFFRAFSGNAHGINNRPQFIIEYYVPHP